jgi:hypothetical protein
MGFPRDEQMSDLMSDDVSQNNDRADEPGSTFHLRFNKPLHAIIEDVRTPVISCSGGRQTHRVFRSPPERSLGKDNDSDVGALRYHSAVTDSDPLDRHTSAPKNACGPIFGCGKYPGMDVGFVADSNSHRYRTFS